MDNPIPERWTDRFDDRQLKQIAFCRNYEQHFNHGAPGHIDMLTISKLAACLTDAEVGFGGLNQVIALLEQEINGPNPKKGMRALRELLADYAHEAWAGWMKYLFEKCDVRSDTSIVIPGWAVDRWQRQMNTPYAELPESEKVSDRAEADKMIAIVREAVRA